MHSALPAAVVFAVTGALLALAWLPPTEAASVRWLRRWSVEVSPSAVLMAAAYLRRRRRSTAIGTALGAVVGIGAAAIEPTVLWLSWLALPLGFGGLIAGNCLGGKLRRSDPSPALAQLVPGTVVWTRRLLPVAAVPVALASWLYLLGQIDPDPSPDPLPEVRPMLGLMAVVVIVATGFGIGVVTELAVQYRRHRLDIAHAEAADAALAVRISSLRVSEGAAVTFELIVLALAAAIGPLTLS